MMYRVPGAARSRIRSAGLLLLALLTGLPLAGCGTASPDDPNRAVNQPDSVGTKLLLGDSNPQPLTAPVDVALKRQCPPVEILEGAAAYRVFDGSGSTDPFSLRYQATLAQTARECSSLGVEAGIRVGVVGRVIVGPKGAPGTFQAPLRIAVVDDTGKPLYSETQVINVTVPPGAGSADFTRVEDSIVVPIPANRFRGWRILVGYDPAPAGAAAKAQRPRG